MIARLKPLRVKPARIIAPQCSAEPEFDTPRNKEWRQERYKKLRPTYDPKLCQRESTVEIDGKPYCSSHGGSIALKKWLRGDLVEHK